jgi:hypothetical protein
VVHHVGRKTKGWFVEVEREGEESERKKKTSLQEPFSTTVAGDLSCFAAAEEPAWLAARRTTI